MKSNDADIITRRDFFKVSSLVVLGAMMPIDLYSKSKIDIVSLFDIDNETRKLNLYNVNSKKHLDIEYYENGQYIEEALREIYKLMGDRRTGEIVKIDHKLLDTLHKMQLKINTSKPIELISGYRSPNTNKQLRKVNKNVARESYHTFGKAADIKVKGASLAELHNIALDLSTGGVGYYPKSDFIHLDVGPIRNWRG